MIRKTNLTAQNDEISQVTATGNSDLRDDHIVPTDPCVVPNLHEIIDLGPLSDDSVTKRSAVDCGARAYFDPILDDHPAYLRYLDVTLGAGGETETGLADLRT